MKSVVEQFYTAQKKGEGCLLEFAAKQMEKKNLSQIELKKNKC